MEKSNIFNWLASKWYIKLFSLITAILLWLYVYNVERTSEKWKITIEFRNKPSKNKFYTTFDFKETVQAKISGEKKALERLQYIKCIVDLSSAKSGTNEYEILVEKPLFAKVDVTLDKKTIKIPFQAIIEKLFPVKLNVENPNQFQIDYVPKSITVKGPENTINKIKGIKTKHFEVNYETSYKRSSPIFFILKKNNSKEILYSVRKLPKIIKIISPKKSPRRIIYTASKIKKSIRLSKTKMRINDVEIIDPNISPSLTLVEKNLKLDYIIYEGPAQAIDKIQEHNVRAYINLGNISKPGQFTVEIIPQGFKKLKVVEISPSEFQVTLKKKVEQ